VQLNRAGLYAANNLSDLSDIPTARDNLGLVTATAVRIYKSGSTQTITGGGTHQSVTMDAEEFDDDGQHFTSAAAITGTVTKTSASTTLVGSSTAFTTDLSVGQIIDVPGTAVERRVITAIASNTSLTVNVAYGNSASGQTATRINSTITFLEAGRYRLEGQMEWTVAAATGNRQASIWRNGVTTGTRLGQNSVTSHATSNQRTQVVAGVCQMAQWDYVELSAYQDSGSDRTLAVGTGATWLSCDRVS
jgi:hypothetical protein